MAEQNKIRAVIFGLGPMGIGISELLIKRGIEIVYAFDYDEKKIGIDLGRFLGLGKDLGVKISDQMEKIDADIVIHSTTPLLDIAKDEIIGLLKQGYNVISTCEELVYPINENYTIAEEIDRVAQKNNVSVIATGSNPGFILDTLPIFLSLACHEINKIIAVSIVDPLTRNFDFQKKSGAGLTIEEFKERLLSGEIKHPGLSESIAMIANSLGIKIDKIKEKIEPIITDVEIITDEMVVPKGFVCGKEQIASALMDNEEKIVLVMKAIVNTRDPCEEIVVEGTPSINLKIIGGLHGDSATSGIVVNLIERIIGARPGLRYMNELIPHYKIL